MPQTFGDTSPANRVLRSGDTMAGDLLFPTDKSILFNIATNFIRYDNSEGKFWIATSADNAKLKFTYGGGSGYLQIDQFGYGEVMHIGSGQVTIRPGESSANAKVGGCIADFISDAGNTGTSETDLFSKTFAANVLNGDGNKLMGSMGGILMNSASTKQLKLYFGGTVIFDSGALTTSAAASWDIRFLIMQQGSTAKCSVSFTSSGTSLLATSTYMAVTSLNFGSSLTLKLTGTAAGTGAATDDIVAKVGTVDYRGAQ